MISFLLKTTKLHFCGSKFLYGAHGPPLLYSAEIQQVTIPLESHSDLEAVLEIGDGILRVLPMTRELCPNQICCHFSPPISKPGQIQATTSWPVNSIGCC